MIKRLAISLLILGALITIPHPCQAFSPDSLFSVPIEWKDDSSATKKLSDFAGQPIIITMAFASCRSACPLTMQRLKELDLTIRERKMKASVVVVSLDPENDSPEVMHKFRKNHQLMDSSHWHFFRGSLEDTRKMSLLLGISYQKNPNTSDITHSNKLLLIDGTGVLRAELEGLGSDLDYLADELQKLGKPASGR